MIWSHPRMCPLPSVAMGDGHAVTMMPTEEVGLLMSPITGGPVAASYQSAHRWVAARALLTADIAVNGVKVPLSVRGQWLRDGHHRFAVAVDLGLTELPVEYGDEYA